MIHPDVREALEEIQQNLKNEMISAKVMLKEYGDKSGIHACHRDRLFGSGRRVLVSEPDGVRYGIASGIDRTFRLIVQFDDGTENAVDRGEIEFL